MPLASPLFASPTQRSTSSLASGPRTRGSRLTACLCLKHCRHVVPSPRPLIVGVDTIAGALGRVNNGNPITPDFEFQAPRNVPELEKFEEAFEQLSNILGRNESASSTPQNMSPFTTPPQQITRPINPQFSAQSAASSRSNESGREPNSSLYAIDFVRAAYRVLTDELKKVAWFRGTQFRIKAE